MKHIPTDDPTTCGTLVFDTDDALDAIVAAVVELRAAAVVARLERGQDESAARLSSLRNPAPARRTAAALKPWPRPRLTEDGAEPKHTTAVAAGIVRCRAEGLHFVDITPWSGTYWAVDDDQNIFRVDAYRAVRVNSKGIAL